MQLVDQGKESELMAMPMPLTGIYFASCENTQTTFIGLPEKEAQYINVYGCNEVLRLLGLNAINWLMAFV